jgi:Flp pilus assembly protein TadG
MKPLSRFLRRLRSNASGNATLLVALGMPALIGGAGLAVDTAQWYLWKRELQYAVDQAALAGAWARTDEDSEADYVARATQEIEANLSVTAEFSEEPEISLANYAGGTNNSVVVSLTASKALPFSSFLTGTATNVSVFAQASFEEGAEYTSCLIAVDEDDDGAITIGGSSVLTAGCGMAALSNSDEAITVTGNPDIDAGWILAKGGIDDWFEENTDDAIQEYLDGLYDPFAELTPPNPPASQVQRTYACNPAQTVTKADIETTVTTSYAYKIGSNQNNASPYNYPSAKPSSTNGPTTQANQSVANDTVAGSYSSTSTTWTKILGSGASTVWEVKTVTTTKTYSNVTTTSTPAGAYLLPGTYTDLNISCNTIFAGGIYILNGGTLDINAQYQVTGSGVMFVLKNGAGISINGGAAINLTAMTAGELMSAGLSIDDANKLAGMLIFEDPTSSGNTQNLLNGNASTTLNGTIYLPKSGLSFKGTAEVTSQCLMIAAKTIDISGDANMTSFCPPGMDEDTVTANAAPKVKLVA